MNYNRTMLLKLSVPIFIESLLRILMGNINVLMISRYSEDAVGAIGVANQVISMLVVVYGIVSLGSAIAVGQYLGAGNNDMASKVANVALVLNFLFGLTLSIVVVVSAGLILELMNIQAELTGFAHTYIVIVGGASFTQALMGAMSAISRSYGQTRFPMFIAFGVHLLNIAGNAVALYQPLGIPVLGIKGVAFSAAISQTAGVIAMVCFLYRHVGVKLRLSDFKPFPGDLFKLILRIGIPAAGESMAYTFSQLATTAIVNMIGSNAIIGMVYVMNLSYFVSILGSSLGQGTQIIVSHLAGAGKTDEAYKTCMRSVMMGSFANCIASLVLLVFRMQFLGFYTDDVEILRLCENLFFFDFMAQVIRPLNHVIGNSLRAAGDVKFPMIVSSLSFWGVSVTLCYILGVVSGLGLTGVWIAFAIDESVRGFTLLRRWKSRVWQSRVLVTLDSAA